MIINTHHTINQELCGTPIRVKDRHCTVTFTAIDSMAADDSGLVHGGFIFGLADYAAMLAVNHPNVVLGGASVRFLRPVKVGETMVAEASVTAVEGKKHQVVVTVKRDDETVFEGDFACFVPGRHVLDPRPA
ncbi:PaaI family thioesterase [Desulfatiferula olefinivorans]